MLSSRNFRRRDTAGEDSGESCPEAFHFQCIRGDSPVTWAYHHDTPPKHMETHGSGAKQHGLNPLKSGTTMTVSAVIPQGLFYYNKVIISWTATFSWFMRTFTLHKYSLHHWDSSCSKQTREAAYAFSKASTISIRRLVYKIGCQSAVCKLFHEPKGRAELPVAEVK